MHPELTVPDNTTANLRRSVIVAGCLGLLSIIVLTPMGYFLLALFGCVGLGLGALNSRLVQLSVLRFARDGETAKKSRFVGSVFGRLGLITLLAVVVGVLLRPSGLGVFAGLAAFQLIMLISAAVPLVKELKRP